MKDDFRQCCISMSFDDGRDDNYIVALPILQKYNLHSTFNITTGYIDGSLKNMPSPRPPMTMKQVCALKEAGHEIAGHGHMHLNDVDDILLGLKRLGGVK